MLKTFAAFCLCFFFHVTANAQTKTDSTHISHIKFAPQPIISVNLLKPTIPQNFNTQHLPFFCDKEYKLEKLTKIPFRFRLGSVAYCDKLEGKNN